MDNQPFNFMISSDFNPQVSDSMFLPDQSYEKNLGDEQCSCLNQLTHRRNIDMFWGEQLLAMQNTITIPKSQHQLSLTRIKKVMKYQGNVKMISSDTPILFSKACELFIMELTLRSWMQTEEAQRRTVHRCDIAKAIRSDELLRFLQYSVPFGHDCRNKDIDKADKSSEGNVPSVIQEVPRHFVLDPPILSSPDFHYYFPSK